MSNKIVIAIDGFSSCGKSTVAKALSAHLQYIYIDSGAMYRAVTLYFIRNNVQLTDELAIANALSRIQVSFRLNQNNIPEVYLNNENIEEEIRTMAVSKMVSPVSTIKEVRLAMVKQQQHLGEKKGIVMDGRDIGTTVFPNAELKIFLVAHPLVRAQRRYEEFKNKNTNITLTEVLDNLAERDRIDSSRKESPLRKAEDAIEIDNTNLSKEQQLYLITDLVEMVLKQDITIGKKQIEVEKYLYKNIDGGKLLVAKV
jgi:cytidylate kinase